MKMVQGPMDMVSIQVEDMVQAYDGGNKTMQSPNQVAFNVAAEQLAPQPVYNFQTTNISGFQKLMLYGAFFGVAYIIYKKYLKK